MNKIRITSMLVLAAGLATAGVASASAATTASQASISSNWSGYEVGGSDTTGSKQFSSVSGSWVEPSADCSSGQGDAAFWVGLGGGVQQSQALEQVGTQVTCDSSGNANHFAWYELVPAGPVKLDLAINPGDHVSGKVTVNGTAVTVSLSNQTTGANSTKTLQMDNPEVSTAEWIAEAPSVCDGSGNCQPVQLASFGTVDFTNATATADGHTGSISDSNWASQPVALDGSAGGSGYLDSGYVSGQSAAGAEPSSLSSDGSSFSVSSVSADGSSSAGSSSSADGSGSTGGYPSDGGYPGNGYGGYGGGSGYGYGGGSGYGGYGGGSGYDGYGIYG
jgi:hypothetical protein